EALHLLEQYVSLRLIEGDDTERLVGLLGHEGDCRRGDLLGLRDVDLALVLSCNKMTVNPQPRGPFVPIGVERRREYDELVVIEALVGKGDQALMPRSVVPTQLSRWPEFRQGKVENGLVID